MEVKRNYETFDACPYCNGKKGHVINDSYYQNDWTVDTLNNGKEIICYDGSESIYYPVAGYFKLIDLETMRNDYPEFTIIRILHCDICNRRNWLVLDKSVNGYYNLRYDFFKGYE